MIENKNALQLGNEARCSACTFGRQLEALAVGGYINEDGSEERWFRNEPIPIGQVRDCYSLLQIMLFEPERFIYPGQDDTCVNPKKFESRG